MYELELFRRLLRTYSDPRQYLFSSLVLIFPKGMRFGIALVVELFLYLGRGRIALTISCFHIIPELVVQAEKEAVPKAYGL